MHRHVATNIRLTPVELKAAKRWARTYHLSLSQFVRILPTYASHQQKLLGRVDFSRIDLTKPREQEPIWDLMLKGEALCS